MELRRSSRMLWGIVVICATAVVALAMLATAAPIAGASILWALATIMAASALIAAAHLLRGGSIGRIDSEGIRLKSHGVGPIFWEDIDSFSIDFGAEGGELICLHLRDPDKYFSQLSAVELLAATGRQVMGSSLSLRFSADERWSPPATCQSIGALDAPVPRIRLRWWPSDVPPSPTMVQRHTYFSCSDKNEFVAVSSADGELLYWRAGDI